MLANNTTTSSAALKLAGLNSEQLKFNLDALVTNLNLVNIIHQPKPIIIENVKNNYKLADSYDHDQYNNTRNSNQGFNLINANKLEMFSFLAERKLKENEWKSKYLNVDLIEKKGAKVEKVKKPTSARIENSNNKALVPKRPTSSLSQQTNSSLDKPKPPPKELVDNFFKVVPLDIKINDLKLICKQLVNTLEVLEKTLIEYKDKQLKRDYADEKEESKQIRIQNEQIKNSSRLMYNFQNQLRQLDADISRSDKQLNDDSQKSQIISRLINTERYVIKTIESLNQTYPYRTQSSHKLYKNLFKHLNASIELFSRVYHFLNFDTDNQLSQLNSKSFNCNKIINESCDENEKHDKKDVVKEEKKVKSQEKTTKFNKVKPKKAEGIKKIRVNPVTKEIFELDHQKSNNTSKIGSNQELLVSKKIQTAKLFPSSRIKSAISLTNRTEKPKIYTKQRLHNVENELKRARSLNEFEYEPINTPNKTIMVRHNQLAQSSKHDYSNNSINNSFNDSNYLQYDFDSYYDKNSQIVHQHHNKYKNFENYKSIMQRNQQKQKQLENSFNFNQSFNSVASPLKSIQKQTTLHDCYNSRNYGSDYSFIGNLYDRINLMKDENDLMRRKYEKLKYSNSNLNSKSSIPYAECYLHVEKPAVSKENIKIYPVNNENTQLDSVEVEQPVSIKQPHLYRQLRHPSNFQLQRVLEYKKKFSNYSKRNTYLSNSNINEIQLFDRLSDDLFDEFFTTVCYEIESLNNDLANGLLDAELISK